MVDACRNAVIDENLKESVLNTDTCKVSDVLPRDDFLLDVMTPLEVGGRSKPDINYPPGIAGQGFNGCIKNIRVNGQVSGNIVYCCLFPYCSQNIDIKAVCMLKANHNAISISNEMFPVEGMKSCNHAKIFFYFFLFLK